MVSFLEKRINHQILVKKAAVKLFVYFLFAVPCLQRASSLLTYAQTVDPSTVGEDVEEGEWLTTATPSAAAATDPDSFEFEMLPAAPHPVGGIPDIGDTDTEQEFTLNPADIPDISSLTLKNEENQQENEEDDDAVAPSPSLPPPQTSSGTAAAAAVPTLPYSSTTTTSASPSGVLQTRTYDLLISYDNYYHVPRVWLIGYGEDHNPLTQSEVLDDVISDYFSHRDRKTVSVEDHPHRGAAGKVVSIHPCRHAEVMKKLSEMVVVRNTASGVDGDDGDGDDGDNGSGSNEAVVDFKVEHYMVLFLKFISSVVPTIEYDYTMPVGL